MGLLRFELIHEYMLCHDICFAGVKYFNLFRGEITILKSSYMSKTSFTLGSIIVGVGVTGTDKYNNIEPHLSKISLQSHSFLI